MKPTTSPTSSPSLSCRLVRLRSVVAHNGTPAADHLASCESCRAYFASAQQLETALRQQASLQFVAASAGTEDRILRAIRQAAPAKAEASYPFFRYALVGGALAAAAVAVLEFGSPRSSDRSHVASATDYRTDAAELAAAVRALPTDLEKTLAQPATALTQNNGLQREVQNVYSDAQSALDFLRMNFLPGESHSLPSST